MTVEEALRASGFSDSQIRGLDPRAVTVFSGVINNAERELHEAQAAREAAEMAQRSYEDLYENKIAPSLNAWDEEKQRIESERARDRAEVAFYRTQNEEARRAGFISADAPGYVANVPGATPGSPTLDVNQVYQRAGDAIGVLSDIQWEHQRLFGQPLPVSPTELVRRADSARIDPKSYAARTFGWDQRRQQMQQEEQQKHDDQIRAEVDRKWAERMSSNPDMRQARDSRYADAARAVHTGSRPDPIMLNDAERRRATTTAIREDLRDAS
jgi:hypothetical protein